MDTKLTLKLNQDSILQAKNYVAEKVISLSKLVENFFDSISLQSAEMSTTPQYSALVQELAGIITLPTDFDEKREYAGYKTAGIIVQTPETFLIASGLV